MKLRIYTLTHKKFDVPPDPLYAPLHVGRAAAEDLGYPGDDTGENISAKNRYYSELTGLYWIWKNCRDVDAVGTCHYRRYLLNERGLILTGAEYERLLGRYDLVTTRRVQLNNSYYVGFSANHNRRALDATGEAIRELYPAYADAFYRLVHANETYFGNMLVTAKERFDQYCEWLFAIFSLVEERIDLETGEDAYHKRVFGFLSEFLLLVWVTVQGLSVCECKVGMLGEKAETRELKEALAAYFARRDVEGAKRYFLQRRRERPDVLMEASDLTGELRLSMQVIATAGKELEKTGTSVLDAERRFAELMRLFGRLNEIAARCHAGSLSAEDIAFLRESPLSETAMEVAAALLPCEKKEQGEALSRMRQAVGGCWE